MDESLTQDVLSAPEAAGQNDNGRLTLDWSELCTSWSVILFGSDGRRTRRELEEILCRKTIVSVIYHDWTIVSNQTSYFRGKMG